MPKRWMIQAGLIALGAIAAVGTLDRGVYVAHTPLVSRVAAGDSAAREKLSSLVAASKPEPTATAAAPASTMASNLDHGMSHPRIDFWVNRLSTTMATGFKTSLARMTKYADMITGKLEAKQMPTDLAYLALIESEFNPNARSRVQAVGMWQFMKGTAKQYGLTVTRSVDERKNPAKATDAALDYLSTLHDRLGSWYLAAAAYNSGEGTVLKALKKITGRAEGTDADFFRIMPVLPKETQDYVPKLIAAARIGNDPGKYGLTVDAALASSADRAVPRSHSQATIARHHRSTVKRSTAKRTLVARKPHPRKRARKK